MTKFIIKAEVTVTYRYDVEADTLEEALERVADGEEEAEATEIDSSLPEPIAYAIEGQMGWNDVSKGEV